MGKKAKKRPIHGPKRKSSKVYGSSPIKQRERRTKAEMEAYHDALYAIVAEQRPASVRAVYYQASVRGVDDKTEMAYRRVQQSLVLMRRSRRMPYGWISDNTRWLSKPTSFDGPADAIADVARFYRKALWRDVDCRVEIWIEKDALTGVIYPVTAEYDVPLMVARGYASLSFLSSAAEDISESTKPTYIYHLGDYDPSGVNAAEKIEQTLRELAPDAEIHFERLAVTPEQIVDWDLPSRPTKLSDSRSKNFSGESVELDAVAPRTLRDLVREAIERHLPQDQLEILKVAEESERDQLTAWAKRLAKRTAAAM
jgi:hypothetical protein